MIAWRRRAAAPSSAAWAAAARGLATAPAPLRGLTVVALEQAVAAPFCTSRLADGGARVIKVERPGEGDFARRYDAFAHGGSSYFAWLNRGKESLELDLKRGGAALLRGMVAAGKVDVVVQNLAPGALSRLGLGSEALCALDERLVTVDISGYGEQGPRCEYKAYDLLVAAEAGLCAVTGSPEEPGRVGVSVCDLTTGMNAYAAVLQGLLAREKTGRGGSFKVSMFDTVAELMAVPFVQTKCTGVEPRRVGLRHPSIAPYGAFSCADGRKLLISVQNEREWASLCAHVLGDADMARDERFRTSTLRVANRAALDERVQACFAQSAAEDLKKRLLDAGIAFGQLSSVTDLTKHPQLRTVSYKSEVGSVVEMPAPAILPHADRLGDAPRLGQHTAAILAEFAACAAPGGDGSSRSSDSKVHN